MSGSSRYESAAPVRRLRALLLVVVAAATMFFVGGGTASAASSCNQPAVGREYKGTAGEWNQGIGRFTCSGANDVASMVELYSRQTAGSPYALRTSTGWVEQGNIGPGRNWSARTEWAMTMGDGCQSFYVRAWVRWKNPGSASYTTAQRMQTWSPCSE
jgi:hypothetical protein